MRKGLPWWGKELEDQRKEVRRLENNKKNDMEAFKTALTTYNKMVRRSKRKSFVKFSDAVPLDLGRYLVKTTQMDWELCYGLMDRASSGKRKR
jgi:hypothetical protein